ncbi:MAG: putative 2-aminoethylphosphonate ABC transporter permease subunit [Stutzerimonas stutzeri]|jgi:iron(III) transport system permease protein|nr:MAG: putative 2-aminoethylphosphonate ABC transporter permease subunit [Stutzerimonas stutzeri]
MEMRNLARTQSRNIIFILVLAFALLAIVAPVTAVLYRSLLDGAGHFVGLSNFIAYFSNPVLSQPVYNSIGLGLIVTFITCVTAFAYAYGITRSCVPGKAFFSTLALVPILAPSLLPAISLIYMFGNQGFLRSWLQGHSIYGPIGIVLSQVFFCFPYAFLILVTALGQSDARLFESARVLGAGSFRIFRTITLPNISYGLVSACFVVLTISVTDFGAVKVIGGQTNVLALDIYKQVLGQHNFQMGAVVSVILLIPCILSYIADHLARKKQSALISARAVPFEPRRSALFDGAVFIYLALVSAFVISIVATAVLASVASFWPYNLSPTLANYRFGDFDPAGWSVYTNTVVLSLWTAAFGTVLTFVGAYLTEKGNLPAPFNSLYRFIALLPLAIPGLSLGLGYIFFFSSAHNPLQFLYGHMGVLVVCTISHYYTVPHLTAVTALSQIDREFDEASDALGRPWWVMLFRVTIPMCMPALVRIASFFFVSAMTTVGAVIFLYAPQTKVASVTVVAMDDTGDTGAAAALSLVIMATCLAAIVFRWLAGRAIKYLTQSWQAKGETNAAEQGRIATA